MDMAEASPPPKPGSVPLSVPPPPGGGGGAGTESDEEDEERNGDRVIAVSGMRRVYRSRKNRRERDRLVVLARGKREFVGESDEEGEEGRVTPVTQNTSNHYTLNLPGPANPRSDTPYVLLG